MKVPTRRSMIWGAAAIVVLGVAGFYTWMALVRAGYLPYNKWDRRERGSLKVGDPAPDLELVRYDGSPLRLGSLWEEKPVLLVFGSCT